MKIQIKHRYHDPSSSADLYDADLYGANLYAAKNDLWAVLLSAPKEIHALLAALRDGKVDGSVYSGECACLIGTIANAKHCPVESLPDAILPNSTRSAEIWFLAIRPGDTPDKSPIVKITIDWITELQGLLLGAVAQLTAVQG